MSRYCGNRDSENTLKAAEHWRREALLQEGSIFSDKNLWKLEHLQALDQYFIQQPDDGEGSFFDKLAKQLAATVPVVKQVAAELLWVMLLCPSNITESKKQESIQTIWSWSEEIFPQDSPWFQGNVLTGVGSAGTGYNTNRWREFVFAIRTMIAFKQLLPAEQQELMRDGWAFAKWLEHIPECDSRQFRHMILFLLFPDEFERIFGGTDRRSIVSAFTGRSAAQVRTLSALQIDRELSRIRKQQEESYSMTDLDFYVPPLQDLWGQSRNVTWLLAWNPNNWPWDTLATDRAETHAGKTVTRRHTCLDRNARVGDKIYLLRTGVPPRGIVATGNVVTGSYEDVHWDQAQAEKSKTCWYVEVAFTRIQDPLAGDPCLTDEDLNKITIDQQDWSPQASGIEIKARSAGILKKLWDKIVESSTRAPNSTATRLEIAEAKNLILYGPPGTGKTYALNKLIERYSNEKQSINREAWLIQQLADIRWFDAVFAALYILGKKAKVADIINHEFILLKARAQGLSRNISQTVWATLQTHTDETSSTVHYKNRRTPLVFDKTKESIWTLTGNWQEECAEQVNLAQALHRGPLDSSPQKRYEFVTFHQAYSYEDFVEGIRPVQDEESDELAYQVAPGVFKRIVRKAKADPGQRYAIFIDEINRGNIAKIFGELITLIEADKRAVYAEDGRKLSGMEVTLPYSGHLFGVPKNLDIYGAMNTADRSIALLDTALRRRFHFQELMPDSGVISGSRGDGYIEDGEGGVINLRALLDMMNRRIRFLLGRDMTLGHAYFINVRDFSSLQTVFLNQIIPLLQEYFYEDWHRIQLVLGDIGPAGEKLEPQIICHETISKEEILGIDHDDYEDLIEYRVTAKEDLTPDAVRKVYERIS